MYLGLGQVCGDENAPCIKNDNKISKWDVNYSLKIFNLLEQINELKKSLMMKKGEARILIAISPSKTIEIETEAMEIFFKNPH